MHRLLLPLFLLFYITGSSQDKAGKFSAAARKEMMEKVKEAAAHGWQGYKLYAWGADDLKPLTKEPKIWYKT